MKKYLTITIAAVVLLMSVFTGCSSGINIQDVQDKQDIFEKHIKHSKVGFILPPSEKSDYYTVNLDFDNKIAGKQECYSDELKNIKAAVDEINSSSSKPVGSLTITFSDNENWFAYSNDSTPLSGHLTIKDQRTDYTKSYTIEELIEYFDAAGNTVEEPTTEEPTTEDLNDMSKDAQKTLSQNILDCDNVFCIKYDDGTYYVKTQLAEPMSDYKQNYSDFATRSMNGIRAYEKENKVEFSTIELVFFSDGGSFCKWGSYDGGKTGKLAEVYNGQNFSKTYTFDELIEFYDQYK